MSNGNELDPFFGEDAAMGGPQQEESIIPTGEPVAAAEEPVAPIEEPVATEPEVQKSDLQIYLDNMEMKNIGPVAARDRAIYNGGFDAEAVSNELNLRHEAKREQYQLDFESQLQELREIKQKQANENERLRRVGEITSDEFDVGAADMEFRNAADRVADLESMQALLANPDLSDADVRNIETRLSAMTGTPLGREFWQDDTQFPDSPLAMDPVRNILTSPFKAPIIGDYLQSAARTAQVAFTDASQKDIDRYKKLTENLLSNAKEELSLSVDAQNLMNANVGFATDYSAGSAADMRHLTEDVYSRTNDDEIYADAYKEWEVGGGAYEEYGAVPAEIGRFVMPLAFEALEIGGYGAKYAADFFGGSEAVDNWLHTYGIQKQAFIAARGEVYGQSEKSANQTWTQTTSDAFSGKIGAGELLSKSGTAILDLIPQFLGASKFLGGPKSIAKKSIARRVASPANIYLTAIGARSAGAYLESLDDRDDLTRAEKRVLATLIGASEALLASTFRKAEQGIRGAFKKPTPNVRAEAAARLKGKSDLLGKTAAQKSRKELYSAMIGETIEEGGQYLIEQNLEDIYEITQGRKENIRDFDWYGFGDSLAAGLLFGTAGGAGAYRQSMANSAILAKRETYKQELIQIQKDIDVLPDGALKDEANRMLLEKQNDLNALNSIGRNFYSRLEGEDLKKLTEINNRLSELEHDIKNAKGSEKKELIDRFKRLYNQKTEIESSVITEEDLAEIQKNKPNPDNILDRIESLKALAKETSEETQKDHSKKKSKDAVDINEDSEGVNEMNSLLQEYLDIRSQANKEKDPAKKQRLHNKAGKAKEKARKVANRIGINGMDFVNVVGDAQAGKFKQAKPVAENNQESSKESQSKEEQEVDFTEDKSTYTFDGEGEMISSNDADYRLSEPVRNAINRLASAYKKTLSPLGASLHAHNTENSFYGITESLRAKGRVDLLEKDGITYGAMFMNNETGAIEIHLNPKAGAIDVREEFGHAVLLPILRNDPKSRKTLFNSVLEMAGMRMVDGKPEIIPNAEFNAAARKLVQERSEFYKDAAPAMFEEEIIIGFLREYASDGGAAKFENAKEKDTRGKLRKFWDALKDMFRSYQKQNSTEPNIINYNDSLLVFAQKFNKSTKGVETSINARTTIAPDIAPDVAPDVAPDIAPDVAPDVAPDIAPDTRDDDSDELLGAARRAVIKEGKASTTTLQKALNIDFARASKLIDQLEASGVIGPFQGQGFREVLNKQGPTAESRGSRFSSRQNKVFQDLNKGAEIFYVESVVVGQNFFSGTDKKSTRSQTKDGKPLSIKVDSYWQFKNTYAARTGNGVEKGLMLNMYYIDSEGAKQMLNPPGRRLDKDGKAMQMVVPERLSYTASKVRGREEKGEMQSELSLQVNLVRKDLSDLWGNNEKNLSTHTDFASFNPTAVEVIPGRDNLSSLASELEDLMIAKANVQALLDSDLTADDLSAMRSIGQKINAKDNPGIYSMSGMLKESQKQEALENQEEGDGTIEINEDNDNLDTLPPEDGEAFSKGYRLKSDALIRSLSLKEGARIKDVKRLDFNLEEVEIEDLEDGGKAIVAYDQTGNVKFKLFHLGNEEFTLDAGVSQVYKNWDETNPSRSLSLSHTTSAKRNETINQMRRAFLDGKKEFHVFVNQQGNNQMFKNPSVFGPLIRNWFAAHENGHNGLKVEDGIRMLSSALSVSSETQVGGTDGKSGFQIVEDSEAFINMSPKQRAELGWDGNSFNLTNAEQTKAFLAIYTKVSSFPSRKAINENLEGGLIKSGVAKNNMPVVKDLAEALTERNYTSNGRIGMSSGTISTVITVDLDAVFEANGDLKREAINRDDKSPFPYQINGTKDIRKLKTPRNIETLFDVKPSRAAAGVVYGSEMASLEGIAERIERQDAKEAYKSMNIFANNTSTAVNKLLEKGTSILDATPELRLEKEERRAKALKSIGATIIKLAKAKNNKAFLDEFTPKYNSRVEALEGAVKELKQEVKDKAKYDNHVAESRGKRRDNTPNSPSEWNLMESSNMDRALESFQKKFVDKYQSILNLQYQVEKARGGRVAEGEDFKMKEELMYGKAATDLEKLDDKVKDLVEVMKEEGVEEKDLSRYLYALHAKERNAEIINRGGEENGSGMSNEEADTILKELNSKKPNLEKAASKVREILKNTRDTYKKLGLHTKEDIDAWEKMFENYVPLQGLAKDEDNEISSAYPTGGKSLSVADSMVRRAEGRKTEAQNIVAQVIAQNAAAHIKGRTNEATRALYDLIENNPNDKVWKILGWSERDNPNVVGVRVDGAQKWIYFNDASHAETLRGMNLPASTLVPKLMKSVAGWLRRSFTTLNPEFVISNFSRDIQSAIFNAAAESEIEGGILNGQGVVADILKTTPGALKALLKGTFGKDMPAELQSYFEDYITDGGRTGWAYAKDLAAIAKELEGAAGEKTKTQKLFGKAKNFAKYVEGVNDAFENSIRLSSYIAARKNGISREKSAQFAKNITVNFNKHGEYGQTLNAVYLFFNAAVQGTSRLGRSLLIAKPAVRPDGTKREWYQRATNAQKMSAGLALFNAMLTMMNLAVSDDDEDGTPFYAKIPDYVKERNLIFMLPAGAGEGKDYIKIPMPYGFNIFANLGSASTEVAYGMKEIDESLLFLTNSFVSAFSPISFGQSENLYKYGIKAMAPTVLKPFVEAGVNETYFGSPVTAQQSPYGAPKPESSLSFRSPDSVQQFFKWMNEATGGTVHREGLVDVNPDAMWYIFQTYLGGAGQFVTRTGETTFKIARKLTDTPDLKINYNDVPLLRKMYGETSKYYDYQAFSDNKNEIKSLMREFKDPDARREISYYKNVTLLDKLINNTEKRLKVLRTKRREAQDIPDYPTRTIRVQEIRDKERALIMEFNAKFSKYRKQ